MPKRLIVCCDGTWNVPDQVSPTNVTKVALSIAPEDRFHTVQRMFYHRGVGTSRWDRLRGGAFGVGLSRDVCDSYRFLVQNYEPGDALFFFGFSRGAFTARSTVGLVRNAGILRSEHADRVDQAYALYRSRNSRNTPRGREATLFRNSYSHQPSIHFIGVWDTVGALGIPVDGSRLISWFNKRWAFHNTDLSTTVESAYQALAIDEKRSPFKPAVWNVQPDAPASQHVEQVWFSGVHSDVGGGYPDHQLSDIPLLWMVDRARRSGLEFLPGAFEHRSTGPKSDDVVQTCTWVDPCPVGELHKSRKGFYRLQLPLNRKPLFAEHRNDGETVDAARIRNGESVAPSAVQRRRQDLTYRPKSFDEYLDDADYATSCRLTAIS